MQSISLSRPIRTLLFATGAKVDDFKTYEWHRKNMQVCKMKKARLYESSSDIFNAVLSFSASVFSPTLDRQSTAVPSLQVALKSGTSPGTCLKMPSLLQRPTNCVLHWHVPPSLGCWTGTLSARPQSYVFTWKVMPFNNQKCNVVGIWNTLWIQN